MKVNPHFLSVASWKDAEAQLCFQPRVPTLCEGFPLQSLAIYVKDHKHRELPIAARSLEAHYGGFSLSQAFKGEEEARRLALAVPYGRAPLEIWVAGHEGRLYELGPEPEPGDIDPRSPAVVVWQDAGQFLLVASDQLCAQRILKIAGSCYGRPTSKRARRGR